MPHHHKPHHSHTELTISRPKPRAKTIDNFPDENDTQEPQTILKVKKKNLPGFETSISTSHVCISVERKKNRAGRVYYNSTSSLWAPYGMAANFQNNVRARSVWTKSSVFFCIILFSFGWLPFSGRNYQFFLRMQSGRLTIGTTRLFYGLAAILYTPNA